MKLLNISDVNLLDQMMTLGNPHIHIHTAF